jgi:polyisoprenoid-binding protein YceI
MNPYNICVDFPGCTLKIECHFAPATQEHDAMKLFLLLAGALASYTAHAVEYGQIQADKSTINFVSKQMGVPVNGFFKRFSAQLKFDPTKPETAKTRVEIELASVDAGSPEANDEVVGKDWFHVRNFPAAVFESRSVKALGGGKFEVRGALTIKGKSRDAVATTSFREEGKLGVFEGNLVLKRLDFSIGEGPWGDPGTVADEVQIRFKLVAAPALPSPASPVKAKSK